MLTKEEVSKIRSEQNGLHNFYRHLNIDIKTVEYYYKDYLTFEDKLKEAIRRSESVAIEKERKRLERVAYYEKQLSLPKNYFKLDILRDKLKKYTNEETWEYLTIYWANDLSTGIPAKYSNTGRLILNPGESEIELT